MSTPSFAPKGTVSPSTGLEGNPAVKNPSFAPTGTIPSVGITGNISPLKAAEQVQNLSAVYTDPLASYAEYGVPLNPFVDWNEERANRQSTTEKWINGLTKAGITSLGAVWENTAGVIAGLGSLATGGEYYDNFVGRGIDNVNAWAQQNLPNYYTHAEETGSILSNMGTANFWADKVANGVGYTLGSIATMWLGTGELGLASKGIAGLAKAGSAGAKVLGAGKAAAALEEAALLGSKQLALYRAGKAVETGAKLERLATISRISTATERLAVATQMSLAESSVEAREAKNQFIDEQVAKWQELNPGKTVPEDVMNGINESANAVGNATFALNLPMLATSNLIMFGKMFRGAQIGEKAIYDLAKTEAATATKSATWAQKMGDSKLAKAFAKADRVAGAPIRNMITEGAQEGAQFAASEFSRSYYDDTFNDGQGDMSKALGESLSKTFGSKEGLENMIIGAIVGGGSGAVSRVFGADKKLAQARSANADKALAYLNGGGAAKLIQNLEQNAYNTAIINKIEEAHKVMQSSDTTATQKLIAKQNADRLRAQLIRSEATRLNKMGAFDYMLEQLDDAKLMSEDEFKKAFGYDLTTSLKDQTGKSQEELVEEVKRTAELSVKRAQQVSDILAKYRPKNTLLPKLFESLQSDELKSSKALQEAARNTYSQILHEHLIDIDTIDNSIDELYDSLIKDAPELAAMPKEEFAFKVKTGKVEVDENGKLSFQASAKVTQDEKLHAKLNEILEAKHTLNPADALAFRDNASHLARLVSRRQSLVESFNNLSKSPENMDLYVQAEYLRRQQEEKKAADDRATQAIQNAETSEELENAIPEDASDAVRAQAVGRIKELDELEKEARVKFSKMSDIELDGVDDNELSSIEEAALNKEKKARDDKRRAEKTIENTPGQFQRREEFENQAAIPYEQAAKELSDIEEATLGEIQVSQGGNIYTINGKQYLNLNESPTDAIVYDENGERIGVKLTDATTGNEITWRVREYLTPQYDEQAETETAIVDALTYSILLQAVSIRSDEKQKAITTAEAREIAKIRGEAVIADTVEKQSKELTASRDVNTGKAKTFEITETIEDPEAFEKEQAELARLIAISNIGTTAGLTDNQIRVQIEVIKQDLIEIAETLAYLQQLAQEAGFTKEEFNKDGEVITLKAVAKTHKALLKKKITELQKRAQARKEQVSEVVEDEVVDTVIASATAKISKLNDDIAQLNKVAKEYQKIVDGVYEGQDVDAAKQELKAINRKIGAKKAEITKQNNLIQRVNEDRESQKLREDSNSPEGTSTATEGEESEATNIDPGAGSTEEGVDGTTSSEELERLKKQREAAEQSMGLLGKPKQETKPAPKPAEQKAPIAVSGNPTEVQLVKGELKSTEDFKHQIVTDSGVGTSTMVVHKVNGNPIEVYPEMLSSNDVIPNGTAIRFEMVETDWWNENKDSIPEAEHWKTIPIFIVADVNGVATRIGSLASAKTDTGDRQTIYTLIKQGLTPVATITEKRFDSTNIANAQTESGLTFFYSPKEIITGDPKIAVVAQKDGEMVWKTSTGEIRPEDTANVTMGQVAIVIDNPNGQSTLIVASTKYMTEEGKTKAIDHITKENPEPHLFSEIVGCNSFPVEAEDGPIQTESKDEKDFGLNFLSTDVLPDGTVLFSFYSETAKSIVRLNAEELKKCLLGQKFKFGFVEVAPNENGFMVLKTVSKEGTEYAGVAGSLKDEFSKVVMSKKFQVDLRKVAAKESYISPLTGEAYPTYMDYLSSDKEFSDPRMDGLGINSILSVDTPGNAYKSPFYDVGIGLSPLSSLEGGTATEEDIAASSVIASMSPETVQTTQPPTTSTDIEAKKAEYKKEEFPEYQVRVDTPITQKLVNYLADVIGVPRIDIADGKYMSWIKEQTFNVYGMPGSENLAQLELALNGPKQVYDRITKFAELIALKQQNSAPAVIAPTVEPTSTTDIAVDPVSALFGQQKAVSLELPDFLRNRPKPTAEEQKALEAEYKAELSKLNPDGAPMQDLGEEIKKRCAT